MLTGHTKWLALFGLIALYTICSGVVLPMLIAALMSPDADWFITPVSVVFFLPLLALSAVGVDLLELNLLLALVTNSTISVGMFMALRRGVRSFRRTRSDTAPDTRPHPGG